ncbi:MAG TPA: hypothetical protein VFZ27_13085 [Terriglobia bacterium]|nr:hypothetical protein [Terriglobia bacterium]
MSWKAAIFGLAVVVGGCPKRQTVQHVVYVPTPPPAATPSQSEQSIIVQAPAPPAPLEAKPEIAQPAPPEPAPSKPSPPRRAEIKAPPEEPPGAEVPALHSAVNSGQAIALQGQIVQLQQGIEKRIDALSRESLSPSHRKMLDDARGFLQNSRKALQKTDLDLASNWASKADQVVTSLERPR